MSARFAEWLALLAPERRNASSPNTWIGVAAVCVAVMGTAGLVPGTRDFFQLRFWPATLCFLPAFLLGYVGGWLEKSDRLSLKQYGWLLLIDSALLQFYVASLISFSEPPGTTLMAAFFVLVASLHGHLHRVTSRFPYGLVCTGAALVGAIALRPEPPHIYVFAVAGPAALGIGLLLGTWNLRADVQREQQRSLREAVHAQVMQEQSREQDRLAEQLLTLLEHNHDAGNTLSALFMNAQMLQERIETGQDAVVGTSVRQMASGLRDGLRRLRELLESAREVRYRVRADAFPVDVPRVLGAVVAEISPLFPRVRIETSLHEPSTVALVGGDVTLTRIVQNLVLNACQGDGRMAAHRVRLNVAPAPDGRIEIECADDGPGFPELQLAGGAPTAFETTKRSGTGLGLYTVHKLVNANGGLLERSNDPRGGARVVVRLPTGGA